MPIESIVCGHRFCNAITNFSVTSCKGLDKVADAHYTISNAEDKERYIQLTRHELEEADRLCHGNWIEIQRLYEYIDKLKAILDENGIEYPEM